MVIKKSITCLLYSLVSLAQALLVGTVIATPAQAQTPVGSWRFDDGSGTQAVDSSGNDHTATLVNGVNWITGKSGDAVSADLAKGQYVRIPAIDLSRTKAVTVALWANRTYSTAGRHTLFASNSNSTKGFGFFPDDDTCAGIQAALRGNLGNVANCYRQPSSGVWHHLAVVFDKSQTGGDEVRFYVDGVLQTANRSLYASTNTNNFGSNPLYLFSSTGATEFSSGAIDDLRVYDSALTGEQVRQIYNSAGLGPVAVTPVSTSIAAGTQQQYRAGTQPTTVNGSGLSTKAARGRLMPAGSGWQQGFDFRNTATFVTDPPGDTDVLSTTAYPTTVNGVTFGWVTPGLVGGRDRNTSVDPRLAGLNYAYNGSPATFYVDLPSPGTYVLSLAMGDEAYTGCWVQCQVQLLDGNTVLATVSGGQDNSGYFYDAKGNNWPAAAWPTGNVSQQVTLTGTRLTVVVGTNKATGGDITPIAFLGVTQVSATPNFTISASPASLSVQQGNPGTLTINTAISGGFNSAISLSASGVPAGTSATFNPATIPAPEGGGSTLTLAVAASTPTGSYPITVTGDGGGIQQSTTIMLSVTPSGGSAAIGFDFRGSKGFVSDPMGDVAILQTTAYPTSSGGFTFGWANTSLVGSRNRNATIDPRLAGLNFANNGSPAKFYVDLPSAGTYNLSLAMGDEGHSRCSAGCQVQFLDGSTVLATVSGGLIAAGNFYDAAGNQWSAAGWPTSNVSQAVTLTGTRLTVVVGTNKATGDWTPIAFLGVTQVSGTPNFTISASPASLSVVQGNQGTSTITTAISGGFNSSINLSASGMPSGTTVSFNPQTLAAPGSGNSTMTITVGSGTPTGTYPITVTGNGGGIQQSATVTLTVTPDPNFTISASPASFSVAQGNQGTSTITTTIIGGFNSAISLSASGMPSGTTVSFNPQTIPAPGSGNSTMTITVGSSTPTGTYPITVTGNGGGVQQNTTVTLTVTAAPNFTISASPASLSIAQGNQGTSTITTTGINGFNSAITLSASGMPSGTTVSFNPQTIPAPGSGNSTMTITVGANTPTGTYPITVTGSGGGVQQPTTITLSVASVSITLDGNVHRVQDNGSTPSNTAVVSIGTPTSGDLITCEVTFDGHNQNALVSVTDNNNGAYIAAVPAHLNTTLIQWFGIYYKESVVGSPTTVTLTTSNSQPWSAISCQAWKGVATSNSLDSGFVQSQDVLSSPNPTTGANKTPAGNGELVIAGLGLYSSGTPTSGVNYNLMDDAPATQWWPAYWIQTAATATAGNYSWQTDNWTDMMAAFKPATTAGNFTISASPASLSVGQGNQGTSTITTAISGGFNSAISLSASGVPTGTTVSFNPQTIPAPGSGNSTMTIMVGSSTPAGTYPITVTGNGGGIQQTTTVTLTVTAGPNFTISASPASLSVVQGNQGTSTITSTVSGGFNSAISLSASGMPSGTTVSFNPQTIPAPGSGNSTMTITVGSGTPTGTYLITVTGNGGGIQRIVSVSLTVTAQVALSWTASTSPGIAGYNAFRSTTSNGPYTKLNSSLIATTSYTDPAVQSGNTYYYVTTAVDSQGLESAYSNQAAATIP